MEGGSGCGHKDVCDDRNLLGLQCSDVSILVGELYYRFSSCDH